MTHDIENHELERTSAPPPQAISPRELLRRNPAELVVEDDTEVDLSPSNPDHAKYFAKVTVRSFDDLQALGFVTRGLSEKDTRNAIEEDDAHAIDLAKRSYASRSASAACECDHAGTPAARGSSRMRSHFNAVRRDFHPALARVISGHVGTKVGWDSPALALTHRWISMLEVARVIDVAILQDITIGRNGKLHVAAAARSLLARHIAIHRSGQLVYPGSYLKIWANSIQRFSDLVARDALATRPVWSLNS